MRRNPIQWLLVAGVTAGLVATCLAQDYVQDFNEEKLALDQVPAAVREKAGEAAKGAQFSQAFADKSKGFRLVGKNAAGALVVVSALEDGQVLSVTTRTPAVVKKVPKEVTKALEAERKKNVQLKGFRPTSVESAVVFLPAKEETERLFHFLGKNGEGLPVKVEIRDNGQVKTAGVVLVHPDAKREEKKAIDLPPAVAAGVEQGLPGVTVTDVVESKSTGGLNTFTVTGRDAQRRKVVADVDPSGAIVTARYSLTSGEVPEEATGMLQQKIQQDERLTGFRPSKYQRLELRQFPGGGALVFVFLGKNAKNSAYEVRVFADGSDIGILAANDKDLAPDTDNTAAPTGAPKAKTRGKKTAKGASKSG
jgi:hypothetical protein